MPKHENSRGQGLLGIARRLFQEVLLFNNILGLSLLFQHPITILIHGGKANPK